MKLINLSKNKIFYGILSLFSFGILIKTYDYLKKLEKCSCFNSVRAYHNLKINIDFLKAYQVFEMFLVSIFILILFLGNAENTFGKKTFSLNFLSSISLLLLVFVSFYISYNAFMLYGFSKEKCMCVDKWQKYFIYVQGIMGSVVFMRILFLLVLTFLLVLSTNYY